MKTPVGLLTRPRTIVIAMCSIAAIICLTISENSSAEEEVEGEGIPAIYHSMNLWSEMRTYPFHEMPSSGFTRSYQQAKGMGKKLRLPGDGGREYGTNNTPPWTNLGPMNFGGRILSVAFHPTNPNSMWVGSASGGLWKTTTGGTGGPGGISWQYVPTGFPVLGVGAIVVNPGNANEIYIGTGEVYNPASPLTGSTGAGHYRLFRGSYGIGILKTTDGGTTWRKTLDFANSANLGVMDMAIHPVDPKIVFAATTNGIYRTKDSGANWKLIHAVELAMDLCFKPGDPNVLYAGSGNFQSPGTGIYKTINATADSPTFTKLTSANFPNPISGKIMLAISAATPTKVYASIGKDPNTSHIQGLYISNDEGATWNVSVAANILTNQGWYGHDIGVSPTNANRLLWGELDTYLTTNGGGAFTKTGVWSNWDPPKTTVGDITEGKTNTTAYVHADVHRIEASPHDATGNTFFLCTDGGLFRTTDGGTNFNTLNGGLNTNQIYSKMAIHPTNQQYMLLGLQDNEAAVYEGNPGCRRIGSLGDGFHATMNSTGSIQIVESYYFNRRRSADNGATWAAGSGAVAELSCFNAPMVFSKTAGSAYVFAGTIYFKRSTNSGTSFANLNGGVAIAGANNPVIAMVAPSDNVVYFSTAPGSGVRSKLWKTTNATAANPTFVDITGSLPDRYYSYIDVDPTDPNRLVVSVSGFGTSHVYLSNNGGSTWCDIGTGLPDVPTNVAVFLPSNRGVIYVGNDLGVFYAGGTPTGALSAAASLTWTAYNEGIEDAVMVSDIVFTPTTPAKLRLGTYGRGLWERALAPVSNLPVNFKDFKVSAGSNGNMLKWTVSSQINVSRYEIEYSNNASHFTKIASLPPINGAGDLSYTYLHGIRNEVDGYYRIKNVDTDEAFSYSGTAQVKANKLVMGIYTYPNPSAGLFNAQIPATTGIVSLKLYDQAGKLVLTRKLPARNAIQVVSIDLTANAAGHYQLVCEDSSNKYVTTIVKK